MANAQNTQPPVWPFGNFSFFLTLPKSVFIKVNKSYPQCNEGGIPWLDLLGNLLGKHQQSTIHPPNDCMAGRTLHSYKCYFSRRQTLQWRRKWQPTLVFLPGESHGQWSLASYSLQFHKEPDMTEETACTRLIKMFITFCFKTLLSINIYFKMILKNQRFSLYI